MNPSVLSSFWYAASDFSESRGMNWMQGSCFSLAYLCFAAVDAADAMSSSMLNVAFERLAYFCAMVSPCSVILK